MKVHTYEKAILAVAGILLFSCMGALLYASVYLGLHLPSPVARIDPERVAETPPFDQPGVRQVGPNQYEAVVIGRSWVFQPSEIRVPAGAEVTFIATATDVLHGLSVAKTRVNLMLIPGQVTRMTYRFRDVGDYLLICHEYCGIGHHAMAGKVIVE